MRLLERTIGTPLTARAGRAVRLTPAGQSLLRHADQILTAIRVAERDLAHVVGSQAGMLRIATFDSAGATLVPSAVAQVRAAHPAIDVRVVHVDPDGARAMVTRGDADLAVTYRYDGDEAPPTGSGGPARSPLTTIPLLVDQVHLVLAAKHPLAHTALTGLWPLADERWLIGSSLFTDVLQRMAARAGFAAHITTVADDYVAMQALVSSGVGIALIPALALTAHQRDDVVATPVPGWPARRVAVESWPDLLRVPSVASTLEALEAAARDTLAGAPAGRFAAAPAEVHDGRERRRLGDERRGPDEAPWRTWFQFERRSLPRPARDRPERAVLVSDESGTMQAHTWQRDDEFRQLTDQPGGVTLCDISADGETVWWFADSQGDELGVWMVEPFEGGGEARPAAEGVPHGYAGGLVIGGRRSVIARSDHAGASVYVVDPAGDRRPELVYSHPQFAAVGALSADDELLAISHSEHGDAQKPAIRVLRLDRDGSATPVADLSHGPGFGVWPVAFTPVAGSTKLLLLHERAGQTLPMIWDPLTGETDEVDPQLAGETTAWWFPDGTALLVLHQLRARSELYRVDLTTGRSARLPTRRGYISDANPLSDGSVDYLWSSASEPERIVNTGVEQPVIAPTGAVTMAPTLDELTVAGTIGDIHVLVARPEAASPEPRPTVMMVHGGPAAHDADSFDAMRNTWTSNGYTVVHVNYRGSTGYGAEWRNANIGRPGRAELEDIVAVRDALVANGTADPDHLVIVGESWGGYLALLGLGLYPDLWSLGIALVPVADTAAVYDDMMEEIRAAYRVRFGGSPTDVPDMYASSSPLGVAADVAVPVMITAGIHDTRCPIRQIELYVSRLVELGKQHELHVFNRGHILRSRADRLDEASKLLAFVRRHLGSAG